MEFYDVLDHVLALLRQRGRASYRALQVQFALEDAQLEALKDELLLSHPQIVDEDGRGLVWTGDAATTAAHIPEMARHGPGPRHPGSRTRQLTVLFCDLVDSTPSARQLDPEDLREVMRAYQATGAAVIQRFDGYIAQYLGDGLLVYFGYPQAHEDDAQRAVRTGLGMVAAIATLNTRLVQDQGVRLAVRMGIHTGLVVVGEMGSGERQEHLALGETPNLAARLQGLAAPDTVVISDGDLPPGAGVLSRARTWGPSLKGIDTPVQVFRWWGQAQRRVAWTWPGLPV